MRAYLYTLEIDLPEPLEISYLDKKEQVTDPKTYLAIANELADEIRNLLNETGLSHGCVAVSCEFSGDLLESSDEDEEEEDG